MSKCYIIVIMISIVILTKNNQRTIYKVLDSTKSFSEVILLDTGSVDNTLEIASSFSNVKIFKKDFSGFGKTRNQASTLAANDWVLALDSDEVLSDKLIDEIKHLKLQNDTVYSFPFINYYNNKQINFCGWQNEKHIRLYNKKITSFTTSLVHEAVISSNCKIENLKSPIYHYSYHQVEDFLRKMQTYSTYFAQQNHNKKKSSLFIAIYHALGSFVKSYIIKKGFLGGQEGFVISVYNANTAFYKYLKLSEINKKEPPCS